MILCDVCQEEPWDGGTIYISANYPEFVCGCRLCESCRAIIEATMDELHGGIYPLSEKMRTENWGRKSTEEGAET